MSESLSSGRSGVVFSETGTDEQKAEARQWLLGLLQDPEEKIRRYAMAALPKIGAGPQEEAALLELLRSTESDREKKFLEESLNKIGGEQTLHGANLSTQTLQKVQATVARQNEQTSIQMEARLPMRPGLRIHLRCRRGWSNSSATNWRPPLVPATCSELLEVRPGLVALAPLAPFSLGDLYSLRCFGDLGSGDFSGGKQGGRYRAARGHRYLGALPLEILRAFTSGPIRYRLDFIGKGHQRGAIRQLANSIFARCPEILNDAKSAPWAVEIYWSRCSGAAPTPRARPRGLRIASRMCRRRRILRWPPRWPVFADRAKDEGGLGSLLWIGPRNHRERFAGRCEKVYGTDLSEVAIGITAEEFRGGGTDVDPGGVRLQRLPGLRRHAGRTLREPRDFESAAGPACADRQHPPIDRRLVFFAAATVLRPEGRLVFINPLPDSGRHPAFELKFRRKVDLGGFDCSMEMYRKRE